MIVIEIRCDGCDVLGDTSLGPRREPAHMLREALRGCGWLVGEPGGRDLCPRCRPREDRA